MAKGERCETAPGRPPPPPTDGRGAVKDSKVQTVTGGVMQAGAAVGKDSEMWSSARRLSGAAMWSFALAWSSAVMGTGAEVETGAVRWNGARMGCGVAT
ncbi:unnamed protein product [Caretta caretta]